MGENTAIEWAKHTFSPWHGCTKVIVDGDPSAGPPKVIDSCCVNCYAETLSKRFGWSEKGSKPRIWGPKAERRFMGEAYWEQPLKWCKKAVAAGKRELVFCASMSDVFEDYGDTRVGKKAAGCDLDGVEHKEFPPLT